MMRLDELKARYELRKLPAADYEAAAETIRAIELFARDQDRGEDADTLSVASLDAFIAIIVTQAKNTKIAFYGMLRYYYLIGRNDLYIRLTQYTGGIGVIETILDRLEKVCGRIVRERVQDGLAVPVLGIAPDTLPAFTADLMRRLRAELSGVKLERVLSGNNHQIPDEVFAAEKAAYEMALSLENYLADYHKRQVEELRTHAVSGQPWYEQHITDEVVRFVAASPEIQGGVLKDGWIYETKIPYDIEKWLHAATPEEKRYYACHCPFARESVKNGTQVDSLWCHCSGGYVKRRYELLFGVPLHAKCVGNALAGDSLCRFAIDVRNVPHR